MRKTRSGGQVTSEGHGGAKTPQKRNKPPKKKKKQEKSPTGPQGVTGKERGESL